MQDYLFRDGVCILYFYIRSFNYVQGTTLRSLFPVYSTNGYIEDACDVTSYPGLPWKLFPMVDAQNAHSNIIVSSTHSSVL